VWWSVCWQQKLRMLPLLVSLCQAWNQPLALTSLHQPGRNKVSRGLLVQLFIRISERITIRYTSHIWSWV